MDTVRSPSGCCCWPKGCYVGLNWGHGGICDGASFWVAYRREGWMIERTVMGDEGGEEEEWSR